MACSASLRTSRSPMTWPPPARAWPASSATTLTDRRPAATATCSLGTCSAVDQAPSAPGSSWSRSGMPPRRSSRPSPPASSGRSSRSPSSRGSSRRRRRRPLQHSPPCAEYDAQLAAQSEQLARRRVQLESAQAEWQRLSEAVEVATEAVRVAESSARAGEVGTRRVRRPAQADPRRIRPRRCGGRGRRRPCTRAGGLACRLETARERVRAERARAQQLADQLGAERQAAEEQARLAVIRQHQVAAATEVASAAAGRARCGGPLRLEARVLLATAESERTQQNEELLQLRSAERTSPRPAPPP